MNKKVSKIIFSGLCLLTASLTMSFVTPEPVSAGAALPTKINVTDTSVADIKTYYASVNDLNGKNLLTALGSVIGGHTSYTYANAWEVYKITDRDWVQSPLTATQLANYSSSSDNPYLHLLYRDDNGTPTAFHDINTTSTHGTTIDREHVWPKSLGNFDTKEPAGTDFHHLLPADHVNNNNHNNWAYYDLDNITSPNIGTAANHNLTGKKGTVNYGGTNYTVYEPQDCDKGDIARACFYMAARYSKYTSQYDPFLELTDDLALHVSTTSSATVSGKLASLSTLLRWHKLDPVDDFEIHRNNLIYNNYQHNRNPFIDFPEWVDIAFTNTTTKTNVSKDFIATVGNNQPTSSSSESYSSQPEQSSSLIVSSSSSEEVPGHPSNPIVIFLFENPLPVIIVGGIVIVILAIVLVKSKSARKVVKKAIRKKLK